MHPTFHVTGFFVRQVSITNPRIVKQTELLGRFFQVFFSPSPPAWTTITLASKRRLLLGMAQNFALLSKTFSVAGIKPILLCAGAWIVTLRPANFCCKAAKSASGVDGMIINSTNISRQFCRTKRRRLVNKCGLFCTVAEQFKLHFSHLAALQSEAVRNTSPPSNDTAGKIFIGFPAQFATKVFPHQSHSGGSCPGRSFDKDN